MAYILEEFTKHSKEDLQKIGIYKITSKETGKRYIGSTGENRGNYNKEKCFKIRWSQHISNLLSNKHSNRYLQNNVNTNGVKDLHFEILEECESTLLLERELYWTVLLDTVNNGFNITYPTVRYHYKTNDKYIHIKKPIIKPNNIQLVKENYKNIFNEFYGYSVPIKELSEKYNLKPFIIKQILSGKDFKLNKQVIKVKLL